MSHPVLAGCFLGLAVLAMYLSCLGLLLMRGAAARLHYLGFASLLAPVFVMAAVLTEEGLSMAGRKAILIVLILALEGPVLAHILGRAVHKYENDK